MEAIIPVTTAVESPKTSMAVEMLTGVVGTSAPTAARYCVECGHNFLSYSQEAPKMKFCPSCGCKRV
jgi:hypothetical protein